MHARMSIFSVGGRRALYVMRYDWRRSAGWCEREESPPRSGAVAPNDSLVPMAASPEACLRLLQSARSASEACQCTSAGHLGAD